MTNELDVYLYGEPVATLEKRNRAFRLEYLPHYVARQNAIPISVQLPVRPGPHTSETVYRFLENLLPDRPDVRRKWAREAGLRSEDPFSLLTVYGADVAGALEFYPPNANANRVSELIPISDAEIADRIRQIREDDSEWLARHDAAHAFSLGGAQGKFALARHGGQWYEPSGFLPSTHIFKPGVQGYPGSDVTEHLTLRVARSLGLAAAKTEMGLFGGEHTLVVERFDRAESPAGVLRLHQEDLAQATGTSSLNKYERDNGPGYPEIFEVFQAHLSPKNAQRAKKEFAESLVLAWIIGHNDGHSKNYSLAHTPDTSRLAPLYDLNSILPFQPESSVRARDYRAFDGVRLAFTVAGAQTIGDYTTFTLRVLERDAELEPGSLAKFAMYVAANLLPHLNRAIDELPKHLQALTAVKNFPFAAYSQTRRVLDVLTQDESPSHP